MSTEIPDHLERLVSSLTDAEGAALAQVGVNTDTTIAFGHLWTEQCLPVLVAELDALRAAEHWVVARDGGRYCEICEGEVQRGHAYQDQPGTGGLLEHIRCPTAVEAVTAR